MTASERGGVDRWGVKTGADTAAHLVDIAHPTQATVAALIALPKPATLPQTTRLAPYERTAYTIEANLVQVKLEADHDYHLECADDAGNTIVCEIPDPAAVDVTSPWHGQIATCRASFTQQFQPHRSGWTAEHVRVRVTGVLFFDRVHGAKGQAASGVELHPVLNIAPISPTGGSS